MVDKLNELDDLEVTFKTPNFEGQVVKSKWNCIDTLHSMCEKNISELLKIQNEYNAIKELPIIQNKLTTPPTNEKVAFTTIIPQEERMQLITNLKTSAFSYIMNSCMFLETMVNFQAFKINPISRYDFTHLRIDEDKLIKKLEKSIFLKEKNNTVGALEKIKIILAYFYNKSTNSSLLHSSHDFLSTKIDLTNEKFDYLKNSRFYKDFITFGDCTDAFDKLIDFRNAFAHSKPYDLEDNSIRQFKLLSDKSSLNNYAFFRLLLIPHFRITFSIGAHDNYINIDDAFNLLYQLNFFMNFFKLFITCNSKNEYFRHLIDHEANSSSPLHSYTYKLESIANPKMTYEDYINQIKEVEKITDINYLEFL